jgi:uncharacterized protein (DUF169 family)
VEAGLKRRFVELWGQYFAGAELPIAFYYADKAGQAEPASGGGCVICDLEPVRQGAAVSFDVETIGCGGGKRYLGFVQELRPGFAYFLSCGTETMEGERYKKTPELVREIIKAQPPFKAPGRYAVFKRWDRLDEGDEPAVVVFFAHGDVLSGLFTLANFGAKDLNAVVAPFGSGCASIVYHPYRELQSEAPRAVLGMFDVSARPCVEAKVLTLAVPWPKFRQMVDDMEESFLITRSWERVRARIRQG